MRTRPILLSILVIFAFSCNRTIAPNPENVFSNIKYDRVIAYDYNGEGYIEIVDENGQLAKGIKKSVQLDKSQIIEITNLLCDKSTYGDDLAACFDPHLGLVFYKGEKINAYVSVCLACNHLVSSVKIPADESGFSKIGSDGIVSFQNKIGF